MQQAGKSKYHQKRNDKNKHLFHKILLKVKSIPQESSILRGEYNYRPSVLGLFVYVPEFNGIRRVKHGTLNTLLTEKMRFQIFRIIGQFLEFIDIGFDSAHFSHSLNKYLVVRISCFMVFKISPHRQHSFPAPPAYDP
jgi:hypothetical protein